MPARDVLNNAVGDISDIIRIPVLASNGMEAVEIPASLRKPAD